jgi:hypothetical protein
MPVIPGRTRNRSDGRLYRIVDVTLLVDGQAGRT